MISDVRSLSVIQSPSNKFEELVRLSGLDKKLHFRHADLRGLVAEECVLIGYDFTGSDLSNSRLRGADLSLCVTTGVITNGADTRGTVFGKLTDPALLPEFTNGVEPKPDLLREISTYAEFARDSGKGTAIQRKGLEYLQTAAENSSVPLNLLRSSFLDSYRKSESRYIKSKLMQVFSRHYPDDPLSYPVFLETLDKSSNPETISRAIKALCRNFRGDEFVKGAISDAFLEQKNDNGLVELAIIEAVLDNAIEIKLPEDKLLRLCKSASNEKLRVAALKALVRVQANDKSSEVIIDRLLDPSLTVVAEAASLARSNLPRAQAQSAIRRCAESHKRAPVRMHLRRMLFPLLETDSQKWEMYGPLLSSRIREERVLAVAMLSRNLEDQLARLLYYDDAMTAPLDPLENNFKVRGHDLSLRLNLTKDELRRRFAELEALGLVKR